MIDVITVLIIFVAFLLFTLLEMQKEVKESIKLIVASVLLFYIAFNIGDINASKVFMVLGIISILLIPITIVLRYLEK